MISSQKWILNMNDADVPKKKCYFRLHEYTKWEEYKTYTNDSWGIIIVIQQRHCVNCNKLQQRTSRSDS